MPIVALLTDFGTGDPYVGAMKGAILSVCPEATLVDLLHDLPAHDVLAGALALEATHGTFPAGTVFVAVVDPGVGSSRRGLAARAGGHLLVGPDNGLLMLVLRRHPDARVRALVNQRLFRSPVSPVFHGRDVFGPVAAHLARGLALDEVGPPVADPVELLVPEAQRLADGSWEATVLVVDRFGNLTTSLASEAIRGVAVRVAVGGVLLPFVKTYADVAPGRPCALVGSSDRLEIAVREGSAAAHLGIGRGAKVRVLPK
jgi:S-adenosyl-L-methionine hydrolase (adenosine-forming)